MKKTVLRRFLDVKDQKSAMNTANPGIKVRAFQMTDQSITRDEVEKQEEDESNKDS